MEIQTYTTGIYMKKPIIIFLLLLITFNSGCIFNSDDGDDSDNSGNGALISAADYFPLVLNAFWTRTLTNDPDGGIGPDIYMDTVTMSSSFEGNSYYIIDSSKMNQQWFRIGENIVYSVISRYSFDKPAMQSAVTEGVTKWEAEYLVFGVKSGTTWKIGCDDSYEITGIYRGLEDITVPAGTFEDCAKFEIVDKILENGAEMGVSTSTILWLGKGVGVVREEFIVNQQYAQVSKTTIVLDEYDLSGSNVETFNVAGFITDSSRNGVANVEVSISDLGTYTTTNTGLYVFTGIPRGTYEVIPSRDGYGFDPQKITVGVYFDDVTSQNFSATVLDTFLAETYFPTTAGTYYEYDSETTFVGGAADESSQYTDAVTGATTYEGTNYIVYQRTDTKTGDILGIVYLRLSDNTVWEYLYNSIFFNPLELPTEELDLSGVKEIPVFNFKHGSFEGWSIYTNSAILSEGELEFSMIGAIMGFQDITVPAGIFPGCVKFRIQSEFTYVTGTGPLSVTTTGFAYMIHWMAPDVGTVRRETTISSNNITVSTKVDELTFYDIPQ